MLVYVVLVECYSGLLQCVVPCVVGVFSSYDLAFEYTKNAPERYEWESCFISHHYIDFKSKKNPYDIVDNEE